MDLVKSLGLSPTGGNHQPDRDQLRRVITAKLAAHGTLTADRIAALGDIGELLDGWRLSGRLGVSRHCPADGRIQAFLERTLAGCGAAVPHLPLASFVLDRH